MSCLAIIPARAGSEGVKNKNVALLGDIPLLVHAIRAARQRGVVDVVVTTDSPAYADLASKNGAEVVMRLPHQADAAAPLDPVLIHALNAWERAGGRRMPEYVATLQPDVPFRRPALLPEALEQIQGTAADSLLCLTPLHFVWSGDAGRGWRLEQQHPDVRGAYTQRPNRQAMGSMSMAMYHETGLLYLTRTPYLLATGARLGGVVTAKMVSALEAMEIDTEEDMARARALWGIWKP